MSAISQLSVCEVLMSGNEFYGKSKPAKGSFDHRVFVWRTHIDMDDSHDRLLLKVIKTKMDWMFQQSTTCGLLEAMEGMQKLGYPPKIFTYESNIPVFDTTTGKESRDVCCHLEMYPGLKYSENIRMCLKTPQIYYQYSLGITLPDFIPYHGDADIGTNAKSHFSRTHGPQNFVSKRELIACNPDVMDMIEDVVLCLIHACAPESCNDLPLREFFHMAKGPSIPFYDTHVLFWHDFERLIFNGVGAAAVVSGSRDPEKNVSLNTEERTIRNALHILDMSLRPRLKKIEKYFNGQHPQNMLGLTDKKLILLKLIEMRTSESFYINGAGVSRGSPLAKKEAPYEFSPEHLMERLSLMKEVIAAESLDQFYILPEWHEMTEMIWQHSDKTTPRESVPLWKKCYLAAVPYVSGIGSMITQMNPA
ncbi:MAG: hypothetical protein H7A37_00390 [Chlamydiales bacterium]|nr:hypothetical protein [Chlamydiia bacterium]MCP5506751.1 hypothetical protein [Chlamydiales bacterium]